jgi:hypothetical protein
MIIISAKNAEVIIMGQFQKHVLSVGKTSGSNSLGYVMNV